MSVDFVNALKSAMLAFFVIYVIIWLTYVFEWRIMCECMNICSNDNEVELWIKSKKASKSSSALGT